MHTGVSLSVVAKSVYCMSTYVYSYIVTVTITVLFTIFMHANTLYLAI